MQTVTRTLLLEYHAGRATTLQVKLIEDWLKNPQNEPLFYETLLEWENASPQYIVDTTAALERFQIFLDAPLSTESAPIEAPLRPMLSRSFFPWLAVAAVGLLLIVTGWIFQEKLLYQTYATSYGQIENIALSDGSKVVLNANSTLRVPRFFFHKQVREVFLKGEAEFSVIHTISHQPFRVKTERQLNVEVLGTEFVVFARNRATRVVLTKGKVKLAYQQPNAAPKQLTMRPGEEVTLTAKGDFNLKTGVQTTSASAWKEHKFVFNDTPLREIGNMIKDNYGLDVAITTPELANRMVTGTFEASSANELLMVLRQLLDIEIVKKKNKVIFSEKNLKS